MVEEIIRTTKGLGDRKGIERITTSIVACTRCGKVSIHRSKSFETASSTNVQEQNARLLSEGAKVLGKSVVKQEDIERGMEETKETRSQNVFEDKLEERFQKGEIGALEAEQLRKERDAAAMGVKPEPANKAENFGQDYSTKPANDFQEEDKNATSGNESGVLRQVPLQSEKGKAGGQKIQKN